MIRITDALLESIEEFKNNVQQFKEGKIEAFKSFGSKMGIYGERGTGTFMVRPRIPGGVITLEQFKAISEITKKYPGIIIRITTRQDIQLHSVKLDDLGNVLEDLIKAGLTTKGAGGDGVRNVACSPLSGVAKNEIFDVSQYVEKVTNHLMSEPGAMNLPRKLKIAFSNTDEDTANATIADLGFIAKIVDGMKGFEVYSGGGLGGSARTALKLEDFIEDTEVLYYAQAVKEIFEKEGDRTNRHKARLRFVVNRLGEEEYIELFKNQLDKIRSERQLSLNLNSKEEKTVSYSNSNLNIDKKYERIVFPQKREGYYSVYIHPENGSIDTDELDRLLDFIESIDYSVSIRLTLTQGFFVRDLKEEELKKLISIASKLISTEKLYNSVACVGPIICNFGLCNSQGLLADIKKTFRNSDSNLQEELPIIHISGCLNSCGQHQIGEIGFTGRAKRTEDGFIPAYAVSFGGKVGPGVVKLGEAYGDIPAKKISKFLLDLAALKNDSGYKEFDEFVKAEDASIKELVLKYSTLESFAKAPELYSDFGTNEKFSVGKK
ncbi:sulfite reductase (ferredoxin) [Clostridium pascui]|uniref:nitrite/sulfite reductase n=1 Tax=Clostridium pascui TaxID=46609 RepID=UPI0019599CD1|nr:nitrite/sulfite reductase [Clostridium pascui]MBM7871428.1 sulfite reductase (ferredoxin) [Clostridium pascui]